MKNLSPYRQVSLDVLMDDLSGVPAVKVAIIDGPVDGAHSGLAGKGLGNCQEPRGLGCRHGTFITGLLAAARSCQDPGICPDCSFLVRPIFCEALDFQKCPLVTIANLAQAVRLAVAEGARIINLSLGLSENQLSESPREFWRACDEARARGALIVCASGNHGSRGSSPLVEHPWIIPVAAADALGRPLASTNVSRKIVEEGLLAPGENISGLVPGGGYGTMSGSSVAVPFVTGTLALLASAHPAASAEMLKEALLDVPREGHKPPLLNAQHSLIFLNELMKTIPTTERNFPDSQDSLAPAETGGVSAVAEPAAVEATLSPARSAVIPQSCGCGGGAPSGPPTYVYALGTIKPVFPTTGLKKEFQFAAQQLKKPETDYFDVLIHQDASGNYDNLYIAEQICWVMEINNIDTYIIKPRTQFELLELIYSLQPPQTNPVEGYTSLVVGVQGPVAPPEFCNGLQLPFVLLNQLFYFTWEGFIAQISGKNLEQETVRDVITQLQNKPNDGVSDSARALNYVAFRFPEIYAKADQLTNPNNSSNQYFLESIRTTPNDASGPRKVEDVIFRYQQFDTGEQQSWYCSVDVSGMFPFLNTPLRLFVPRA